MIDPKTDTGVHFCNSGFLLNSVQARRIMRSGLTCLGSADAIWWRCFSRKSRN